MQYENRVKLFFACEAPCPPDSLSPVLLLWLSAITCFPVDIPCASDLIGSERWCVVYNASRGFLSSSSLFPPPVIPLKCSWLIADMEILYCHLLFEFCYVILFGFDLLIQVIRICVHFSRGKMLNHIVLGDQFLCLVAYFKITLYIYQTF